MKMHKTGDDCEGGLIPWHEVFPLGEDGKRHPTQSDLLNAAMLLLRFDIPSSNNVRHFLERFADVAPKD